MGKNDLIYIDCIFFFFIFIVVGVRMKYFLCYVLLCEIEDVLIRVFNLIV